MRSHNAFCSFILEAEMSTGSSYLLRGEERQRMWLMASSSEMFRFLMLLSLVATSPQSVSANLKIPTTAPSSNLFNEYITRGLFTCTRDYVKSLTDLHVLMRVRITISLLYTNLGRISERNGMQLILTVQLVGGKIL